MENCLDFYRSINDEDFNYHVSILSKIAVSTLRNKGRFIFAGNGGSFSIANHIAAELTGRFLKDRDSIPAIVLAGNIASLSSIANDYDFSMVFVRELKSILKKDDMLILMSTSGRSKNILKCYDYAMKKKHENTVLITGKYDLDLESSNGLLIKSPSKITARIQEYHLLILHEMCAIIDLEFNQ